ncbi:WxL domain surface cell wall-binding [Enterococcus faecalis]|uniref:WxL domain-containing protein n=1 Tax=Enterococcus faecalis TaxID=1351 RepID=UPI000880B076|nr:WxL domain-containing protein [Enterococcus faecalis]SDO13102.1 WxL domain surface cell wall-binding [Enterococcus faecalis]
MKRNKWQRLATIGLCSSLVMNAFSGVTAVAETVTIESSPTAESSAQEETQASSVKEETTKASTENSQVTTDTSQEEATKEAEKQAETEVKEEQKEEPQAEVEQAETPATSSENDLQKSISPRWVPNNQSIYPRMTFGFTDETGKAFADETLTLSGTYYKLARHTATSQWRAYADRYPIVSSNAGGGQYRVAVNAAISVPYDFLTNLPAGYAVNIYAIEQLKIDNTLKYVDSIVAPVGTISVTRYSKQQVSETPQFGNYNSNSLTQRDRTFSKSSTNIFSLNTKALATNVLDVLTIMRTDGTGTAPGTDILLMGFDGTPTYRQTLNYVVTRKQVTEKFVNTSGVAITPPTGFTQNKKTPMTSNAFTFKQAGTLPDTYTAGGKTYKFKGWYKGKTKPSTLTTTKAPSYAVTYDGNDDLNVVYEETKEKTATIPAVTYKFGFVDEKGALVAPTNFNMTTNLTTIMNGTPKQVGTASGVNNGNLKQLTIPSQQLTYTPSVNPAYSGSTNLRLIIPKRYKLPTVKPGTYYTGSSTAYPIATTRMRYVGGVLPDDQTDGSDYTLATTTTAHSYRLRQFLWESDATKTTFDSTLSVANATGNAPAYYTTDETMYYFLENRRVTENFVDTSGTKITPPTGFTQGKKTVITSDAYTFKQAGTLPDTYTTGGKTYKFKGWYKGKSILNTLTTTKAPSYQVTCDDNDDLNVVYEEVKTFDFPESTYQFGFVDVATGNLIDPSLVNMNYTLWQQEDGIQTNLVTNQKGVNVGNLKSFTIPEKKYQQKASSTLYGPYNMSFTIPKQYKTIDVTKTDGTTDSAYPIPTVTNYKDEPVNITPRKYNKLKLVSGQTFGFNEVIRGGLPEIYSKTLYGTDVSTSSTTVYYKQKGPVYYYLTNRTVTENFVDTSGAKITPPTGFTQGNQIPMTSDAFKYTAAKALPATYTAGGKTYTFQGWYKGKAKPSTLNQTTTPTFNATFDDNDDMTAMYKEEVPRASAMLIRTTAETVASGGNVTWRATITNPSKAPLTTATIKKSTAWTTGLAAPTSMIVTPVGGTAKTVPVTATTWTNGVSLGIDIPAGKTATVQFTTRATGTAGQVLRASITTSGNYSGVSASATVRVKDNDQEIVTPTTEGFISVPTFDFGQVGVVGSKQQHSLKQAADYYGNGTRNPYVRIKKTQPNWSLTAQLSQPKSATDSLPTATRLLLGAAPVSSFTNYNQPTELKNAVGTTSAISLTANNTATSIIANKQFTGSNVYQLDFTFNNVKLEVPANQGVKGQQYKAAVTWNLVTGP